jgi:hypothetical protein
MTVVVAGLVFGSLLSPLLGALLLVGWVADAPTLLTGALALWGATTLWMAINAGVRHGRGHGQELLEALAEAPGDMVMQLGRLVGVRPRGLRAV